MTLSPSGFIKPNIRNRILKFGDTHGIIIFIHIFHHTKIGRRELFHPLNVVREFNCN